MDNKPPLRGLVHVAIVHSSSAYDPVYDTQRSEAHPTARSCFKGIDGPSGKLGLQPPLVEHTSTARHCHGEYVAIVII